IEHISFKNYYCAFVSVRVLKRTPGREAQWSTALRDLPLMENQEKHQKNYYCAFVSVRVLKRTPGREAQWSTALRDLPLMENPHTEPGSQDYFSVHRDQMLVEPDNVVSVRLILRQPSSAWLTFNLEDIKIHPHTQPICSFRIPGSAAVSGPRGAGRSGRPLEQQQQRTLQPRCARDERCSGSRGGFARRRPHAPQIPNTGQTVGRHIIRDV
ncbi:hypothetical protein CRUP_032134, partial [Coryphaenoides rupestris]